MSRVTPGDVRLRLAEGVVSAYERDMLSSPLPSSARSGSSQDVQSSDMGESCGLLASPRQRGGRRGPDRDGDGDRAASSGTSGCRRSASGSRTRTRGEEYEGHTLQSLGVIKAKLVGSLARWERDFEREHGGRPTHVQKASSQEYQRTHKELKRASQRLLLLGMSCGSLAEEGTKSSPGRCSRRGSAMRGADGSASGHSSCCASPSSSVGGSRKQLRV